MIVSAVLQIDRATWEKQAVSVYRRRLTAQESSTWEFGFDHDDFHSVAESSSSLFGSRKRLDVCIAITLFTHASECRFFASNRLPGEQAACTLDAYGPSIGSG
jgi:hypothetical protein